MATRSNIIKKNHDGTFDERYHHWDGHIDSLGEFLHTNFDSPKKVDWLFDIKKPLSSIMSSVEQEDINGDNKNHIYYNDDFGSLKTHSYITAYMSEPDVDKRADFQTMKEICDQQYQYFYDEEKNKWSVVVKFNESMENSDLIEVEEVLSLHELAVFLIRDGDKDKTISRLGEEKFNNLLYSWNKHKKSKDKIKFMQEQFEYLSWPDVLDFKNIGYTLSSLFDEKILKENIKPDKTKPRKISKI